MPRDNDILLGPAKEVLDEKEKIEPQQQEEEVQEQQPERVDPQHKALRSCSVPQLIGLFQQMQGAAAGGGAWNEELQQTILDLILEKGGPGAVRRALGRVRTTGDGHTGRPGAPPHSHEARDPAAGDADAADGPWSVLERQLGRAFVRMAVEQLGGTSPEPATADREGGGPLPELLARLVELAHALEPVAPSGGAA